MIFKLSELKSNKLSPFDFVFFSQKWNWTFFNLSDCWTWLYLSVGSTSSVGSVCLILKSRKETVTFQQWIFMLFTNIPCGPDLRPFVMFFAYFALSEHFLFVLEKYQDFFYWNWEQFNQMYKKLKHNIILIVLVFCCPFCFFQDIRSFCSSLCMYRGAGQKKEINLYWSWRE